MIGQWKCGSNTSPYASNSTRKPEEAPHHHPVEDPDGAPLEHSGVSEELHDHRLHARPERADAGAVRLAEPNDRHHPRHGPRHQHDRHHGQQRGGDPQHDLHGAHPTFLSATLQAAAARRDAHGRRSTPAVLPCAPRPRLSTWPAVRNPAIADVALRRPWKAITAHRDPGSPSGDRPSPAHYGRSAPSGRHGTGGRPVQGASAGADRLSPRLSAPNCRPRPRPSRSVRARRPRARSPGPGPIAAVASRLGRSG